MEAAILKRLGWPHFLIKTTALYIDGFNLYYGVLAHWRAAYGNGAIPLPPAKGIKWLNPQALVRSVLDDSHQICKIHYFSADIKGFAGDTTFEQKVTRQQIYLRALKTLPNVEIIKGVFRERTQVFYDNENHKYKRKFFTEKGTDVNIATWLLKDAYAAKYDSYVLVSNDTDLRAPLLLIKNVLAKNVGIVSPQLETAESLKGTCSFWRNLNLKDIVNAQFPDVLHDGRGDFKKPKEW